MIEVDPNLDFFGNLVDASTRLEELKDLTIEVEKFIAEASRKVAIQLKGTPKHRDFLFSESFPDLFYSSVIISTVILLEQHFRGYSKSLKKYLSLELSFNDFSGSSLEKFKKYCAKYSKLDFELKEVDWEDIKGIWEIRNCLIHNNGLLCGFSKIDIINKFSKKHKTPNLDNDLIYLSRETIDKVIEIVDNFINQIYQSALKKFPGEYMPK